MSFIQFTDLPYGIKIEKTQHAYTSMAKKLSEMTKQFLRAIRNHSRMVELYSDILMLNQVIRCSFQHLDCNNVSVLHEYMTEPASHDKVQILLTDSFDLLEDLSNRPMTSAQMDVLFLQAHQTNQMLSDIRDKYKIVYNWGKIFTCPNYVVR